MDLSVDFLGKKFDNPFLLASGPPTANCAMIKRAFDAGWAGAVIKTLIKEPVKNLSNRFASQKINNNLYAFENIELLSELSPDQWYKDIRTLKQAYPHKIVVGSIMGDAKNKAQWIDLALGCQSAGVDFLELNFSCPHGYPEKGKGAAIGQNAKFAALITSWVKKDRRINVPVIPKLTAAVSDIAYVAESVARKGADAISAINTYPSIMGFDFKTLFPKPSVAGCSTPGGYSGPGLKPIALKCVSDLVKRPGLPVMACGGVSSGDDAVEFIFVGAPVVQVCTAVMLNGYAIIEKFKNGLQEFMQKHQFFKIVDFLGLGNKSVCQFSQLNEKYFVKARVDQTKCVGCSRCYVSCRDGGYQAIEMKNNFAQVDPLKCAGCSLCVQVCPKEAIEMCEKK